MTTSTELLQYTKDLSLLFVEDHEELRISTSEILRNFFKKVVTAANGVEALSLYKAAHENDVDFDIVLTDIKMPKMDGVILTEKIYALNKQQTVVVLSAYDEVQYLLPLINLGIDQFITKPIDYQELLTVLLRITKYSAQSQQNVDTVEIDLGESFSFNKDTKLLSHNQENIYLTKYEILFIEQLSQQVGKIYSNEDIANYFSSLNEPIDTQNIRKLVSKLRKKLPTAALESIYGIGYRVVQKF